MQVAFRQAHQTCHSRSVLNTFHASNAFSFTVRPSCGYVLTHFENVLVMFFEQIHV